MAPGIYANIGKTGVTSISAGIRGARMTWGRHGRRATVGLPGSGISYTAYERHPMPPAPRRASAGTTPLALLFLGVAFVAFALVIALVIASV